MAKGCMSIHRPQLRLEEGLAGGQRARCLFIEMPCGIEKGRKHKEWASVKVGSTGSAFLIYLFFSWLPFNTHFHPSSLSLSSSSYLLAASVPPPAASAVWIISLTLTYHSDSPGYRLTRAEPNPGRGLTEVIHSESLFSSEGEAG